MQEGIEDVSTENKDGSNMYFLKKKKSQNAEKN